MKGDKAMKLSMYNHYFKNEESFYVFNSFNNALISLTESEYIALKNVENSKIKNEELLKQFIDLGLVNQEGYDEKNKIIYDMFSERFKTSTMNLTIAPTLNCNFKCPYCYEKNIDSSNLTMSKETEDKIIKYITDKAGILNHLSVAWYGGEPLLSLNIIKSLSTKILKICENHNINYSSSITTNGFLLTPEVFEELLSFNINNIQIPLDGDEEYHNKTRVTKNHKGSFRTILDNLKEIIKTFPNESIESIITLRINVTRKNKDSIPLLLDYLRKEGVLEYVSYYLARIEDLEDTSFINVLNDEEFIEFEKNYYKSINLSSSNYLNLYYPRTIKSFCVYDRINDYVISPDGKLYKCWEEIGVELESIGHLDELMKQQNTRTSVKSYVNHLIFNPLSQDKCKSCKILPSCMGGNCIKKKKEGIEVNCELNIKQFKDRMKIIFKELGIDNIQTVI